MPVGRRRAARRAVSRRCATGSHPVTGSAELDARAARAALRRRARSASSAPECGAGHCGVDLDGPRGRPIVAVADGIVVRVERSRARPRRPQRPLRPHRARRRHADRVHAPRRRSPTASRSAITSTAASTSARSARPRCTRRRRTCTSASRSRTIPGMHGDNTDTHYVDPAPFLVRAHVVLDAGRRASVKPPL